MVRYTERCNVNCTPTTCRVSGGKDVPINGEAEYPNLAAKFTQSRTDVIPPSDAGEPTLVSYGTPKVGNGVNPLVALRVEPVMSSPVTVEDYVKTVDFRFLALQRWIESGENRVALETIARIEGDLQQIRLLLRGAKKLAEG